MNKLIESIKNIFNIQELRTRILYTLLLLAIFRIGSYVILPGIHSSTLERLFANQQGGGILDLLNTFVGGAFSRGSIFALGIMPYISASIIIQLLATAIPFFQKLQKEGESGTKKINQYTRYLTIIITGVQAAGYVVNLQSQYKAAIMTSPGVFWISTVFILTAGTLFLVWLGERITDKGIGNGVSLIIAIGIIADLPSAIISEASVHPAMIFYAELIALALVTMGVILLTTGTRKIPVNYARPVTSSKMLRGLTTSSRKYIPLKINASGVMPIIFAQAIMFIPATITQFISPENTLVFEATNAISNPSGLVYNVVFFLLIIVFTYFYTAIAVNPNDIADQLKKSGGFIPGIKPGKNTSDYIDETLTRITLPGSIFLAIVAIMPAIVNQFGVSMQFANFFGGTSLLIMIGVVLDTLQQIESYLLMRHYDGIMKSGRSNANKQVGISF